MAAQLQEKFVVDHGDSRLESRVARIEADVANVRERISIVEVDLRDLRKSVDGLRDSTTAEFRSVRAEMASEFKAVRAEMAGEFKAIRTEMASEFGSVRSEMSTLKIMIILIAIEVLATGWPRLYQDISGILWHLK